VNWTELKWEFELDYSVNSPSRTCLHVLRTNLPSSLPSLANQYEEGRDAHNMTYFDAFGVTGSTSSGPFSSCDVNEP